MKVLVTGANGFIGKNLCLHLLEQEHEVLKYDLDTQVALSELVEACDFVMHLAGVNRPQKEEEFTSGNADLTKELLTLLKESNRKIPILLSSSIQAERDNPYGISKRQAEEYVKEYGRETGAPIYIYRLENAFGKWCKPNYNSVIATFCHNIARDLPIEIHDENTEITFVYIDDIVKEFISCLTKEGSFEILHVTPTYKVSLGTLASLLKSFKESRNTLELPYLKDGFEKKLYSTYLSYLPEDQFSYPLNSHVDMRGSFTEFIRSKDRGQVSVNIQHPGIIKGNHYHHTKNEKFLVVAGQGIIRFRKLGEETIIEYPVSCEKLEVIDIPVGYTHDIINTGTTDMVTIMWANEEFDAENPDTYYEEV